MNEQQASGIDAHRDQRRRLIADALERDCPMTAEQQGSDESGEGLSEALRKAARDHIGLSEGEFWPSSIADAQAVAVERILADRLATVLAEAALYLRHIEIGTEQLATAEAALATARRDADELRDRLAAVEALADGWTHYPLNVAADALRAALANPSAAQGEGEVVCDHPGIDHDARWSYCAVCPACDVCKFIGHGPLCIDCYATRATNEGEVPR